MSSFSATRIEEMIELCEKSLSKAYAIYSKFPVAAVIVTEDDKVFTGCNVENSSYGLAICAERTAAVKAVSEGYRKFKACFVMTNSDRAIGPCGACRQFLSEFADDMIIYLIPRNKQFVTKTLDELLPFGFNSEELESGMMEEAKVSINLD